MAEPAGKKVCHLVCPNCLDSNFCEEECKRSDKPEQKGKVYLKCSSCKFRVWQESISRISTSRDLLEKCFWCSMPLNLESANAAVSRPYFKCLKDGFSHFSSEEDLACLSTQDSLGSLEDQLRSNALSSYCRPTSESCDLATTTLHPSAGIMRARANYEDKPNCDPHHKEVVAAASGVSSLKTGSEMCFEYNGYTMVFPSNDTDLDTHPSDIEVPCDPRYILPCGRRPSTYQLACFKFMEDKTKRNAVVEAVAGSGKSTTILKMCELVDQGTTVLYLAFNRSVRISMLQSVYDRSKQLRRPLENVQVETLNSWGYKILRNTLKSQGRVCSFDGSNDATKMDLEEIVPASVFHSMKRSTARKLIRLLTEMVDWCKNVLARTEADVLRAVKTHFPDDDIPEEVTIEAVASWVFKTMESCRKRFLNRSLRRFECSFTDQTWVPVVCAERMKVATRDFVLVDETQDLNACQLELVKISIKRDEGRVIAVGDDSQAIYGFRGADSQAMDRMKRELNATVLGLSVSYRCPKLVVKVAKQVESSILAAPEAPDGSVTWMSEQEFLEQMDPGYTVLSRTNAPLATLCLILVRKYKLRHDGLTRTAPVEIIVRSSVRTSLEKDLDDCEDSAQQLSLSAYILAKNLKCQSDFNRGKITEDTFRSIQDRLKTLEVLSKAVGGNIPMVRALIRQHFPLLTEVCAHNGANQIVLSTVHGAKGSEWDNVYVLYPTFYTEHTTKEERNLWYVAVTRSRKNLVVVGHAKENLDKGYMMFQGGDSEANSRFRGDMYIQELLRDNTQVDAIQQSEYMDDQDDSQDECEVEGDDDESDNKSQDANYDVLACPVPAEVKVEGR